MKRACVIINVICFSFLIFLNQACGSTNYEDIAEAVFRCQLQHYSHLLPDGGAYFIQLDGKDPSDAFMNRFEGHTPLVKRASACNTENKKVVDMQTQKTGLLLRVHAIMLRNGESAQADGGFYKHGLAASVNTYFLIKKNGKWIVVKDVVHEEA